MTVHEGHEKAVFGCDDCIKAAGPAESPDGDWYCIEKYRTSYSRYFLRAESVKDARAIADEVKVDDDFFDVADDDDVVTLARTAPEKGEPVWGPDGWESA